MMLYAMTLLNLIIKLRYKNCYRSLVSVCRVYSYMVQKLTGFLLFQPGTLFDGVGVNPAG